VTYSARWNCVTATATLLFCVWVISSAAVVPLSFALNYGVIGWLLWVCWVTGSSLLIPQTFDRLSGWAHRSWYIAGDIPE
jgi:hypothetical protein